MLMGSDPTGVEEVLLVCTGRWFSEQR
jgi:hypothetical protein